MVFLTPFTGTDLNSLGKKNEKMPTNTLRSLTRSFFILLKSFVRRNDENGNNTAL